jgi:hypothetical protein
MTLPQRCHEEHNTHTHAVIQPRWIMDQLYILLATLHTVLAPLALLRVRPQPSHGGPRRTVRQQGRFVQDFTNHILCLAQTFMPEMFLATQKQWFPLHGVLDVIRTLIDAAVRGDPRPANGNFNFRWDGFYLDEHEHAGCCHDMLRGYIAAMSYQV